MYYILYTIYHRLCTTVRALQDKLASISSEPLNFLAMKGSCIRHMLKPEPLSFLTHYRVCGGHGFSKKALDEEIGWGTTGLRNSGHWIKKLEPLDTEIETTGLRNWNRWIKKLVWEH